MDKTQELLDKHETFKLKGLQLTIQDIFDWVSLKEQMKLRAIELESEILEEKRTLEKDKALRTLTLKADVDDKGKSPTEKTIDSKLKLEFEERDRHLDGQVASRKVLLECADNVIEYINAVKLFMKTDNFTI